MTIESTYNLNKRGSLQVFRKIWRWPYLFEDKDEDGSSQILKKHKFENPANFKNEEWRQINSNFDEHTTPDWILKQMKIEDLKIVFWIVKMNLCAEIHISVSRMYLVWFDVRRRFLGATFSIHGLLREHVPTTVPQTYWYKHPKISQLKL